MHIKFWKWEGAGNDFIVFDRRDWPRFPSQGEIEALCDRNGALGADGIILFNPLDSADPDGQHSRWEMDYLNSDGSRSFCGNGSRALFALLRTLGRVPSDGGLLEACDGPHAVRWNAALDVPGVEMRPILRPARAVSQCGSAFATFADTGSPHHIEWMTSIAHAEVERWGRAIRHSEAYQPGGVNVDFAQITGPYSLAMRTYERGVEAETKACGTGAVAAAVADFVERGGTPVRHVDMAGGRLTVEIPSSDRSAAAFSGVWLYGAAKEVAQGVWDATRSLVLGCALAALMPVVGTAGGWTDEVQVSILTGSPGPELYSAWGHTAIRVLDMGQTPPVDWTYNYGTFEFSEGFYGRFLRGELNYRLAKSPFSALQQEYLHSGRAILEQHVALSPEDARALIAYLEWNYLPENRVYAYKFFEDNCASRILTVLGAVFGDRWDAGCSADPAQGIRYREALRPYMHGDPWIEAGIDLILGPRADRPMPPCGASFLPDGLMAQLELATLDGVPVIGPPEELLPPQRSWFRAVPVARWGRPEVWSAALLIWTLAWSVRRVLQTRRGERCPQWERRLGKLVQPIAGMLGGLLLLMWLGTDHADTWANWNLVWASPLLALLAIRGEAWLPLRETLRMLISVSIVIFLIAMPFVPQFVSLIAVLLAWAVWLSLDPWQVPQGVRKALNRR